MFEVQNPGCEGQNPSYEGEMSLWAVSFSKLCDLGQKLQLDLWFFQDVNFWVFKNIAAHFFVEINVMFRYPLVGFGLGRLAALPPLD